MTDRTDLEVVETNCPNRWEDLPGTCITIWLWLFEWVSRQGPGIMGKSHRVLGVWENDIPSQY